MTRTTLLSFPLVVLAALVVAGCGREVRSDDPSQPALLATGRFRREHASMLGEPEH